MTTASTSPSKAASKESRVSTPGAIVVGAPPRRLRRIADETERPEGREIPHEVLAPVAAAQDGQGPQTTRPRRALEHLGFVLCSHVVFLLAL